jgi:hypothetical protein
LTRRDCHPCTDPRPPRPSAPYSKSLFPLPRAIAIDLTGHASVIDGDTVEIMALLLAEMRYSIHGKTLAAKKARILTNALIDCAKAGIKPSFAINKMLWGISLYFECGSFSRENWQTYHRVSDAAKQVRASGGKNWKKDVTFEHVRPLSKMYQMLLDERETLTLERAAVVIGEYPPILITMEEELRMAKLGFKVEGTPEQRYREVPISGFSLRSDGTAG